MGNTKDPLKKSLYTFWVHEVAPNPWPKVVMVEKDRHLPCMKNAECGVAQCCGITNTATGYGVKGCIFKALNGTTLEEGTDLEMTYSCSAIKVALSMISAFFVLFTL